jgi:hypothetical protein
MSLMKHFGRVVLSAVCVCALLLGSSCEHRPLEDLNTTHFLRVYLNENIQNVTYGFYDDSRKKPEYHSPELLRVGVYDKYTGELVSERYLHQKGSDARGNYLQGYIYAPVGEYNILAYNYDTRSTQTHSENDYGKIVAFTNTLTEGESNRLFSRSETLADDNRVEWPHQIISHQPDHIFAARMEGVQILPSEEVDTLCTPQGCCPTAESLVKTYYIQVNIKGAEYVRSAVALISGMAGSKTLHDGQMVMDDVTSLYFPLNNAAEKMRTGNTTHVAYASFNTFGKLPHVEGYIDITFEFKTTYNTVQTATFRLTDMFDTPVVQDKQWIIIDKVIEITPPEGEMGGGMQPGVGDWKQHEGSIVI